MVDSYPEYLNPFAEDVKPKNKSAIKNSFNELKRTLRRSFRIKKKPEGEVTLRQKSDFGGTFQRSPVSYPNSQPEALPRSRFRERLSHGVPGSNPFEEEEENEREVKATIRRRGKKRAPLPPNKSISSQCLNDDRSEISAGSHWSLTSVDTDYSGSVYTVDEQHPVIRRDSIVDKFIDFNRNMNALKDDTNNNVVTKEEIRHNGSNSNIPDLVVSCPSKHTPLPVDENHESKESLPVNYSDAANELDESRLRSDGPEENTVGTNLPTTTESGKETAEQSTSREKTVESNLPNIVVSEPRIAKEKAEESTSQENTVKSNSPKVTESDPTISDTKAKQSTTPHTEESTSTKDEETESLHSKEDDDELIIKDITNNLINGEGEAGEDNKDDVYLYHEKKSLYIAGSRDELNDSDTYTGRVSLYITGSRDDLDSSNNNEISKDENSNHDEIPTPKQRKNKLSKNILLGM